MGVFLTFFDFFCFFSQKLFKSHKKKKNSSEIHLFHYIGQLVSHSLWYIKSIAKTFHTQNRRWFMTGKNKNISPQDWIKLLKQHHSYIKKCPGEIIARFDADKTGRLACAQPTLATQLNLNSLSKHSKPDCRRNIPHWQVFSHLHKMLPRGKLVLSHFPDNCNEEEIKIAAPFLANLFPFLTMRAMDFWAFLPRQKEWLCKRKSTPF